MKISFTKPVRVSLRAGWKTLLLLAVAQGSFSTCASSGVQADAAKGPPSFPNFNHDVSGIIYQHCSGCHREGGSQPVLLTYSQVSAEIGPIAEVLTSGRMPPWKPVPGFGDFKNARILPLREKQTILQWIHAGAPEGDPAERKVLPTFSDDWELGTPDLVVSMPKPFLVRARGADLYQCFVLKLGFTEDRPISAFEVRPGNHSVLHHSIIFIDGSGAAGAEDDGSGYECFGGPGFPPSGTLGGWSPGARAVRFPEGIGKIIKRGSNLVMQNHYHPNETALEDKTSVGIYFSHTPPGQFAIGVPIVQENIDIPPGKRNFRIDGSFVTPVDLRIFAIFPHMHLLGREMKVSAYLPNQQVIPLIWITDWDFNWQGEYFYATPFVLPKGTKVVMEMSYDNSSANSRNPNHPPKRVIYGDQSTDEMAVCVIEASIQEKHDSVALQRAILQQPGIGHK